MYTFAFLMAMAREDYHTYKPLCFGYLASYLRKYVPDVQVQVFQEVEDLIAARPDAAGFSATTTNFRLATRLAGQVKQELGIPVMIGGVHISVLSHKLPEEFDIGILGEGEETFRELAMLGMEKGAYEAADLQKINGICYRDNATGKIVKTQPRELIQPLDQIPRPDRKAIGYGGERAYMFTSRGCPYDCQFCSSQQHWGKYRTFSPEYVLAEIDELIEEFHPAEIHFFDDLFVANFKRLTKITDGIVARGWQKDVEFSCTIRANVADEKLMETLKRMEIRRVTFGAESCSDPILRYLKGDNVTAEMNQRAVDLCHQYDIRLGPSFIKGAPQETGEDLLATYDFILRNIRSKKIDYFEIHNLTPFPGTPIWDYALEKGLVHEDMDWDELKVPWENLYLNEQIPKSSFYFFESLTKKGQKMLGLWDRRLIGVADISCMASDLAGDQKEETLAKLVEKIRQLEGERFLDRTLLVDLSHRDIPDESVTATLATAGLRLADDEEIAGALNTPEAGDLFVYFEMMDGFESKKIYDAIWHHFETDADVTRYAETRFFTPASPFEKRVFVFSPKAIVQAYEGYFGKEVLQDSAPDLGKVFLDGSFRVSMYRPDEDPFVESGMAARVFQKRLSSDFKLDRMNPEQRAKRMTIIEERIHEKTKKLPGMEARRRALSQSGIGKRIRESDSKFLKALVKFFLYRD